MDAGQRVQLMMTEVTVVRGTEEAAPTLFCGADHGVIVLVGLVVVGLHQHPVLSPEHLGVLAVSEKVLVVQLQVPQGQPVLLHSQGLKLQNQQKAPSVSAVILSAGAIVCMILFK